MSVASAASRQAFAPKLERRGAVTRETMSRAGAFARCAAVIARLAGLHSIGIILNRAVEEALPLKKHEGRIALVTAGRVAIAAAVTCHVQRKRQCHTCTTGRLECSSSYRKADMFLPEGIAPLGTAARRGTPCSLLQGRTLCNRCPRAQRKFGTCRGMPSSCATARQCTGRSQMRTTRRSCPAATTVVFHSGSRRASSSRSPRNYCRI